jgi:hypothetical protein
VPFASYFDDENNNRSDIIVLIAVFLFVLSFLIYLIGIYFSRIEYPDYIANYPDIKFISITHPLILPATILMGISVFLFAKTKRELMLLLSLITMGIFLWNTNILMMPNPRTYDGYWHYSVSQFIIDNHKFGTSELASYSKFYLNYPFTGIFGAEFSLITGVDGLTFIYFFPLFFTAMITLFLFACSRLIFKKSLFTSAVVVLVFFIGNASMQTHFSPQAVGLIWYGFIFYLVFKYFESPEFVVKITIILMLFIPVITHPLTSFVVGIVFLSILVHNYLLKEKMVSKSLVLIFFIFFISWQIYWAVFSSTAFLEYLSRTLDQIFTEGLLETGSTEFIIRTETYSTTFLAFRTAIHGIFICLSILGLIFLWKLNKMEWGIIVSFMLGPFFYFIYTYFSVQSFLYERAIMFIYFPLSITVGYLAYKPLTDDSLNEPFFQRLKVFEVLGFNNIARTLTVHYKQIGSILVIILVISAGASVFVFGLREQAAVVPTQDIKVAQLIAQYDNGSKLNYKTNALLYYYNISFGHYPEGVLGWTYLEEMHKSPDDRYVVYRPDFKYVIYSKKIMDTSYDFEQIQFNLENDYTMIRIYDNGFNQVYL